MVSGADQAVSFAEVLPGVQARYWSTGAGVKEDLEVSGPESWPAGGFVFDVTAEGVELVGRADGGVDVVAGSGERVAVVPPPVMVDQVGLGAVGERDAEQAAAGRQDGRWVRGRWSVRVRVAGLDEAWVADPARVWPVVVDPSVTTSLGSEDAYLIGSAAGLVAGTYV